MLIPINETITAIASFGSSRTEKTVQCRILNSALSVIVDWTAEDVVELGQGEYAVALVFTTLYAGYIQWKDVEDNIIINDSFTIVRNWIDDIHRILKIESGRWRIINNQMHFYDEDNSTILYSFDLKDSTGQPTMTEPAERLPV